MASFRAVMRQDREWSKQARATCNRYNKFVYIINREIYRFLSFSTVARTIQRATTY